MDYEQIFSRFREVRGQVLNLVRDVPGLSGDNREFAAQYIEEFYDIIDNPRRAQREIIDSCRRMRGR